MIIGVGNRFRGDDAAGLAVAGRLRGSLLEGDPATLLETWKDCDRVVLIDAVSSGAAPGTIHRFEAEKGPLPSTLFRGSTHAFGVPDAIELARALKRLPQSLIVYGIEGKNFEAGEELSPEVVRAIDRLVERIEAEDA